MLTFLITLQLNEIAVYLFVRIFGHVLSGKSHRALLRLTFRLVPELNEIFWLLCIRARELIKGRVLENNIEYDARLAAQELAKATRSEVVQVIGTKFVLYRESHSKPREKRIQLVKPSKKRQA